MAAKRTKPVPDDQAPVMPARPHPTLRAYYEVDESRQGFLNDLFDRTARQYRALDMVTGLGCGLWYRRKALREAGLRTGMSVLDVGCGPGQTTQSARAVVGPTGHVIGLDPSSGMLREVTSRFSSA